jgi:hypothetical protein
MILPVPYVTYGTGTIVHAGFVPYGRTKYGRFFVPYVCMTYGSGTIVHAVGLGGK